MARTSQSVQSVCRDQSSPCRSSASVSSRSYSAAARSIASSCPITGMASTGVGDAFIASLPLVGWPVLRQVHVRYLVHQTDPAISARFVGVLLGGEAADDRSPRVEGPSVGDATCTQRPMGSLEALDPA